MTRHAAVLTAAVTILAAQAVASFALHRDVQLPSPPPLVDLPLRLGNWAQIVDEQIGADVIQMLGPDDLLSRRYQVTGTTSTADLFVAYYKTQMRGKNAHDPKVCLPGAGWNPIDSRVVQVSIPGTNSIPVNYYVISKDDDREVVLYWFQTPRGIYSSEQDLKVHRVLDLFRDDRTDMALVRVIVPVRDQGVDGAAADATGLVQLIYPAMTAYLPPAKKRPDV
jgi:EpsI family protein